MSHLEKLIGLSILHNVFYPRNRLRIDKFQRKAFMLDDDMFETSFIWFIAIYQIAARTPREHHFEFFLSNDKLCRTEHDGYLQ